LCDNNRGLNSDLVVVYDEDAVENGSGKKLVDLLNEEHYVSRTLLLEGDTHLNSFNKLF
jgi:hypothetical protein